tara:strand:- start:321 stop:758 length:438 start_codon:yes stop_codon:yes gene_type:complete
VEADCGIAVASGTDVAIDAADIVLMKNNLCDIVTALSICHRTFWRIRLNFFFAFAYNSVSIPVAAGLLYPLFHISLPPAMAAAAMALSSVSVVSSSLALRWFTPPKIDGAPASRSGGDVLFSSTDGERLLLSAGAHSDDYQSLNR